MLNSLSTNVGVFKILEAVEIITEEDLLLHSTTSSIISLLEHELVAGVFMDMVAVTVVVVTNVVAVADFFIRCCC